MPSRTSKRTYLLAFLIVATIASFTAYEIQKENSENVEFLANLSNLSLDSMELAKIDGFQIENENNGSFNVDGNNADPSDRAYYTYKPVSLVEFASSTGKTVDQVNMLFKFEEKHPYIAMVQGDVNLNGICRGANGISYQCTVVKFYLQRPFIYQFFYNPTDWYSSGYMYVPFELSNDNQAYLNRYFTDVKEIAPHWYAFSGEKSRRPCATCPNRI
jgi:hypothetical protein